jgi:hypothetical protein
VGAIKNGQEETGGASSSGALTLMTDEHHMEQVKSVLEHTCIISCVAFATEIGINPASVYLIDENLSQSGFHICSTMTKEPCMFFLSPTICGIGEIKAVPTSVAF